MKKHNFLRMSAAAVSLCAGVVLGTVLCGCGDLWRPKEVPGPINGERIVKKENNKVLVVYFTRSGRTRQVAHWISDAADADLIELKTLLPYPAGYQAVVSQARKEIDAGVKPKLRTAISDMDRYDVVYVGTPNWWGTMAPPVATFLSDYDLSGKTLIPFVTHGGGGVSSCVEDMKKLAPGAVFREPLVMRDSSVDEEGRADVAEWVGRVGGR